MTKRFFSLGVSILPNISGRDGRGTKLTRQLLIKLINILYILGYLKDSNAAAQSIDRDIFYVVIH